MSLVSQEVNGHEEDVMPVKKKKKKKKSKPVASLENESSSSDPVKKLIDFVHKLEERVKASGGISGGGTFHWVDSILVKVNAPTFYFFISLFYSPSLPPSLKAWSSFWKDAR